MQVDLSRLDANKLEGTKKKKQTPELDSWPSTRVISTSYKQKKDNTCRQQIQNTDVN